MPLADGLTAIPAGEYDTGCNARFSAPVWKMCRQHLLAPALACVLVGGLTSQLVEPRYESQARVWTDSRSIPTEKSLIQILRSRDFARHVIRNDALATRLAAPLDDLAGTLSGHHAHIAGFSAVPSEHQMDAREALALRTLERGLRISDIGGGQIAVGFSSSDAGLSADVANAYSKNILELRKSAGPFNMNPDGPVALPARIVASAVPAYEPSWPTPLVSSLTAGVTAFLLMFGFQTIMRRRARAAGEELGAVPLPQTASMPLPHLPWIGAANEDHRADYPGASHDSKEPATNRQRPSRESGLEDLSRLIHRRGEGARLVIVTGPARDDGIAHCAVELGRSLAGAERRVVIVCLDMMAPLLDELTEDARAPGLTDLLFGVASFSDAIHREAASRCHVIPPGRGAREADGLIASERLPLILTALKQTYDHVIVAAPPLGRSEGASRIAALGTTAILVSHPEHVATDVVQAFDCLASHGFGDIAMITYERDGMVDYPCAA